MLMRMRDHVEGRGARWTRLHKPVSDRPFLVCDGDHERVLTLKLMHLHGPDKVRGGAWSQCSREHAPRDLLAIQGLLKLRKEVTC